jgi:hypothetical protein
VVVKSPLEGSRVFKAAGAGKRAVLGLAGSPLPSTKGAEDPRKGQTASIRKSVTPALKS